MTGPELATQCKQKIHQIVLALEDAMAQAPADAQMLRLNTSKTPRSEVGKAIVDGYINKQLMPPTTKTGRLLSALRSTIEP